MSIHYHFIEFLYLNVQQFPKHCVILRLNFALVNKCDNKYTGICYIHYDFLVPVREHLFNFYRSAVKKRLGTTALLFFTENKLLVQSLFVLQKFSRFYVNETFLVQIEKFTCYGI